MYSLKICMKCSVIVFLVIIFILPLRAQVLPVMTYGGSNDERAFALVEATNQDGYVLAGWTKSFGAGVPAFSNVLIVRTDSAGFPLWARISIGLFDDEARSMTQTLDGGYVITGWTKSFDPGMPDSANIFVVKIDSAGWWQWGWVYGTPFSEEAHSIIQTMDGGYAVTGWTNLATNTPTTPPNIFLLKLDPAGMPLWTGIYWFPMDLEDEGYSVAEIPGVGAIDRFLIAGRAKIFNPTYFDAFVMQTDPYGMPVSGASVIPGQLEDEAYSVLWDGQTFLAAGWSNSFSAGTDADIIVWEDDTTFGTPPISANHFGWSGDEKVMDDRSLSGMPGLWQVAGWTTSTGPGVPNPNFLIIGYDTSGFSGRVHPSSPGANTEQAYPMITASVADAHFAVAGFTNSFGQGGDDFHLLTLDGVLSRPVCVIDTLPPHDVIPVIPEFVLGEPNFLDQFEPFPLEDTSVMYTRVCTVMTAITELPKESSINDLAIYATIDNVTLQISESGCLTANLYDVTGRKAATLAQGMFEKGTHVLSLPEKLSAGVYFIRVDFTGILKSTKVVRLR